MTIRFDRLVELLGTSRESDVSLVAIDDVEHDSRRVGQGTLFACIRGEHADGHDYAAQAVRSGAAALLVERRLDVRVPQLVVADVRASLGAVASAVHENPSSSLRIVGITGTNGKTTTVSIVASLLRTLGQSTLEIGTLTGERTTPEAPELQRQFRGAVSDKIDVVVMEVSSHALEQDRVAGTRFAVSAFTNLGVDHLDHHGDLESYYRAKAMLFSRELSDFAVIDATSPAGVRLESEVSIPHVAITGDLIDDVELLPHGSRFRWRGNAVASPLAGAFNVSNAVVGAEVVAALGHRADAIAGAFETIESVPGRFEMIDVGQPFGVVVDYAHTPDGLEAVLEAARTITRRFLIVVFGAGGDRDVSKRPQMGEVARRLADRVVVTSDNPRSESPQAIVDMVVDGMSSSPELVELDRQLAIRHAIAGARDGDVVVIAGKGHEVTQTIGNDVLEFDDRVVARQELRRLGGNAS